MPRRPDVLARRCFIAESYGHLCTGGEIVRQTHRRVMRHLRERPVLP